MDVPGRDPSDVEPGPPSAEVVARLVDGHREFLAFLERRLPSREVAEEILQSAFVKTLERGGTIDDEDSATAWFYRLLRNAMADYYRRRASEGRALEREAAEPEAVHELELRDAICACMKTLLPTLKPEYAELLQRVELEDQSLVEAAAAQGITVNNAAVRLHRARKALEKQLRRSCGTCATHGCLDCSCGGPACH